MDGWSHSLHVSFVFLVNPKKCFNEVELSALEAVLLGCGNVARDVRCLSGEGFACSVPEFCLIHLQLHTVIQGAAFLAGLLSRMCSMGTNTD